MPFKIRPISCSDLSVAGKRRIARSEVMLLVGRFLLYLNNLWIFFANIFLSIFMKCDVRTTDRLFFVNVPEPWLVLDLMVSLLYSVMLYSAVGEGGLGSCCIV